MSSLSTSGSRLATKEEAQFHVKPLEDQTTLHAITTLLEILESSIGTRGHLKLIHNDKGGHVTVTSSAERLLRATSISNPVIKLIVAAVQGHAAAYSDGTLFCGLLSLYLLDSSLKLDIHRHLIVDIHETLLKYCLQYVNSEACKCKMYIDSSNVQTLVKLVRGVIGTKPGCGLFDPTHVEFVSRLVLEAFIKSLPNLRQKYGSVQYLCIEGKAVLDSHVIDGVMFEAPHIPTYRTTTLAPPSVQDGEHCGQIRVVLYDVSMSGDSENYLDVNYDVAHDVHLNDVVLGQMMQAAQELVTQGVGMVLCQKVVHPRIKKFLKERGVLVLDRLGLVYISALLELSGAGLLSSFSPSIPAEYFGYLQRVSHEVMEDKSYLHLEGTSPGEVSTLVLCHRTSEALEEMKHVCTVANHVLKMTVSQPYALTGAGCWQSHLVEHLHKQVQENVKQLSADLGCTHHQLQLVANNFNMCLHRLAMSINKPGRGHLTDSANHHIWLPSCDISQQSHWSTAVQSCCCGLLTKEDAINSEFSFMGKGAEKLARCETCDKKTAAEMLDTCDVLDAYLPAINALRTGVVTANTVLSVQQYIHDTN